MRGRVRSYLIVALLAIVVSVVVWTRIRPESSSFPTPLPGAESGVLGLIVEPDDGRQPVLTEIAAARSSIDLMVYLLTDEPVINALLGAEERDVEVRVILDQYPFGGFGNPEEVASRLRDGGVEVKWGSDRFTFTHAKTLIVDDSVALIMNLNLTRSAFESNREFAIVTTRPADVQTVVAMFDADWRDEELNEPGSLVLSPLNSRAAMADLLDSAVRSVEIYAEVIRDEATIERLLDLERRGVVVRIVISSDSDPVALAILQELAAGGVEIRLVDTPYIHAKAIIADDRTAFIGSQNLTATSQDENREVGMLVRDEAVLMRLSATFERDYAAGESLPVTT